MLVCSAAIKALHIDLSVTQWYQFLIVFLVSSHEKALLFREFSFTGISLLFKIIL